MAFALTLGGFTFVMAVIWGSPLVEIMRRLKLGKQIRIEGPQEHLAKMGTPAMGGVLIVGWTLIISIVVNIVQLVQNLEIAESVIIPLGVMVAYSILGGIDDYLRDQTNLPVRIADEPRYAVVRGLEQMFDEPLLLRRVVRSETLFDVESEAYS